MINIEDYLSKFSKDDFPFKIPPLNTSIFSSDHYKNLTPYKGFDSANPNNARQNNYAWAMCDFNDYIYVGTGRNLPLVSFTMGMTQIKPALDYSPEPGKLDMTAEIWRYKKDGSLPWERVYKARYIEITNPQTGEKTKLPEIIGFRSLIKFESFNIKPSIYAAAYSTTGVKVLKSTNGVDWFDIPSGITGGTSSRSIIEYNKKLYMAVMNDGTQQAVPSIVYSSDDPELNKWTLSTPTGGEDGKNPIGVVWSMSEFNNKLYLGTASQEGFMVWRTNGREPKLNDWTLVMDKGGGDAANSIAMSLKEFKGHLYVGSAYDVSDYMIYVIPKGADIFRIDTDDNWELVVGGKPMKETNPTTGTRNTALSNYMSGFNNPYNIYMWQFNVYKGKFYVGTYDESVSVEPTLELFIKNKDFFISLMGDNQYNISVDFLKLQIKLLSKVKKLLGFDLYVSDDGINFTPLNVNGFNNRYNYGIRNIFISEDNEMYFGTANPFQGCEVYKYQPNKCYEYKPYSKKY